MLCAGGWVGVCVWFGAAAHMVSASLAATSTEGGAFSAAAKGPVVMGDIVCVGAR